MISIKWLDRKGITIKRELTVTIKPLKPPICLPGGLITKDRKIIT